MHTKILHLPINRNCDSCALVNIRICSHSQEDEEMLKRVLIMLFALIVALSVVAGCNSGTTTTTGATTTATTAATTKATTATTAATTAETTADPATKYQFPWQGDPITLTYFCVDFSYAGMIPADGKLIDDEFKKLLGNVTIDNQSVGWADYGTKTDLFFSSGELPDILVQWNGYVNKYGSSGFLLDFSQYLDFMPNYKALYDKYPATFSMLDDKIFAVQQPRDMTILSKEWIANGYYTKQGISIPTTYDEVYAVCKQVKELNPDIYPLNFSWGGLFMNDFNTSNGVFYNNDTGKWEYGLPSADFKEYVTFMAKMYTEKLLNPNQYDTDWGDQWLSIITDPTAWFLYSGYNEVNDLKVPAMVEKEPTFSVEYMLPPKAGDNHVWIPIEAQPGTDTWFIYSAANTANPEFLCAFMNYMISDEVGVLVNWGVEGKTFTTNTDGSRSFMDNLILPSRPGTGTVDPIKELSLYPHFMCKQYGALTKNDFVAMYDFHVDQTVLGRTDKYAAYIEQNPKSARWNQPTPLLTTAEADLVANMMTDINTYADEQIALFLTGKRDIAEWDAFLTEVLDIGNGQTVADLYNDKPQLVLVNE